MKIEREQWGKLPMDWCGWGFTHYASASAPLSTTIDGAFVRADKPDEPVGVILALFDEQRECEEYRLNAHIGHLKRDLAHAEMLLKLLTEVVEIEQ